MKNAHVARLDRQLRLHGEPVQLARKVSGVVRHRLNLTGIVKTFAAEQLIGAITQNNYLVILSPTELRKKAFPGAVPATIASGTIPPGDENLPSTADAIIMRGGEKAIGQVSAIYDGDQVVRIEIKVTG
ncbi:hypothetical protein NKH17_06780 [Mesorhizobium sp. M1334]|uniref:hypothetical protein n=1 Tax=Mesorhizobium sp. M1334 TaxID=2957084 RepID=UPI00333A3733